MHLRCGAIRGESVRFSYKRYLKQCLSEFSFVRDCSTVPLVPAPLVRNLLGIARQCHLCQLHLCTRVFSVF